MPFNYLPQLISISWMNLKLVICKYRWRRNSGSFREYLSWFPPLNILLILVWHSGISKYWIFRIQKMKTRLKSENVSDGCYSVLTMWVRIRNVPILPVQLYLWGQVNPFQFSYFRILLPFPNYWINIIELSYTISFDQYVN